MKIASVLSVALGFILAAKAFSDEGQVQIEARLYWSGQGPELGLISAPTLVIQDGATGTINDVVESFAPTAYDAPRIPKSLSSKVEGGGVRSDTKASKYELHDGGAGVIPPFPKNIEAQEIGLNLEFKPSIQTDGSVNVECSVRQRALRGFINRGIPLTIDKPSGFLKKKTSKVVIEENRQLKPEFLERNRTLSFNKANFEKPVPLALVSPRSDAETPEPWFGKKYFKESLPELTVELQAVALPGPNTTEVEKGGGEGPAQQQILLSTKTVSVSYETTPPAEILNFGKSLLGASEFESLLATLTNRKGVDLFTAPALATRNELPGKVEVIREFIYPTEFNPVEIRSKTGSEKDANSFPVTPIAAKEFATAPIGVICELSPRLLANGSIKLQVSQTISEFEGFLDFGAPVFHEKGFGKKARILITENEATTPVFLKQRMATTVSMESGMTAMIGGIVRNRDQQVQDKIPVFGDLPLIGRLGRKTVTEYRKELIYFFITAKLVDSAGSPVAGL